MPGIIPKLSANPGAIHDRAPALGEHTDAVLAESGFDAAAIADLRAQVVHGAQRYPLAGPAKIEINDVAPRDGLQIEPVVVPTEGKVAFVNALAHCGFARIEATSFIGPRHSRAGRCRGP